MMELFWLSCTQKYIISLHKVKKLIGTVFLCLSAMTPKVLEIYFRSSEEGCSTIDGMVRLTPVLWLVFGELYASNQTGAKIPGVSF